MKTNLLFKRLLCLFILAQFNITAQDWQTVFPVDNYNRYNDIHFHDSGDLSLVGNYGYILRSSDQGMTWNDVVISAEGDISEIKKYQASS